MIVKYSIELKTPTGNLLRIFETVDIDKPFSYADFMIDCWQDLNRIKYGNKPKKRKSPPPTDVI